MEILDTIWTYLQPVWAWLMEGVTAYGPTLENSEAINWMHQGIQMGVIALVMALLMQSYAAVLIFTVVGVVVHVIVDEVLPIVRDNAAFAMPDLTAMPYWQYLSFAALTYLVGITILYMIKSIIFRGD